MQFGVSSQNLPALSNESNESAILHSAQVYLYTIELRSLDIETAAI